MDIDELRDSVKQVVSDAQKQLLTSIDGLQKHIDEHIVCAEETAFQDGLSLGYDEAKSELWMLVDSDEMRLIRGILQDAYDAEIVRSPWKSRMIARVIEKLERSSDPKVKPASWRV